MTVNMSLESIKKIHFVGIGGIGMSGLARIMKRNGYAVSGSDLKKSSVTDSLVNEGIKFHLGHRACNLPKNCDVVVVTSAVSRDNNEVVEAKKRQIPVIKRAELLALLCHNKKTVAVAGTHGKTTTTSMISLAMDYAKADSTNVIGGIFKNINSNIRIGKGEYFVTEADESDGTFLLLSPLVAVITNIDDDHLDFYKNMDTLKKAFWLFAQKIPAYGRLISCCDDPIACELLKKVNVPFFSYGLSNYSMYQARNIRMSKYGQSYDIFYKGKMEEKIKLRVFGLHNVRNSLAAYISVRFLGFDRSAIKEALENFSGVKRRLEMIGEYSDISFYDDYGHHPTEIINTLSALKSFFPERRIRVIFQPHRFTRTALLYKEFGQAFSDADEVFVCPIYPAGEKPIKGVTSDLIIKELKKSGTQAFPFTSSYEIAMSMKSKDILLTLGAGDVWKLGYEVKYKLENMS